MKPQIDKKVSSQSVPGGMHKPNKLWRVKQRVIEKIGKILKAQTEFAELTRAAYVIEAQSYGNDCLTDDQLAQLKSHQDGTMTLMHRKKYFREADHTRTLHGILPPHLEQLLTDDPSIKSVLNIGCNYAYMDFMMSKKFPNVQFQGMDVNDNLASFNDDLKSDNLSVRSGYALKELEEGRISADLVYFSSTATVIRNAELKRYLRTLVKKAKYVAFSEPIWLLPDDSTADAGKVDVNKSVPAYIQRTPLTNEYGYLCYIHNYKALLEEAGFESVVYKFYRPEFTYLYWVVAIAQNKNEALWQN